MQPCGHVSVYQLVHLVKVRIFVNAWLGMDMISIISDGTNYIQNIANSVLDFMVAYSEFF